MGVSSVGFECSTFGYFILNGWLAALGSRALAVLLILDSHQAKPLGRRGGPGARAVTRLKDPGDILWRELAATDFHQRPDDVADHMMEETITPNFVKDQAKSSIQQNVRLENAPNAGAQLLELVFVRAIRRGEGSEIVLALQEPRRLRHARSVERIRMVKSEAPKERRANILLADSVTIGLGASGIAGVKVFGDLMHSANANGGWERVIQSLLQVTARNAAGGLKICHLPVGMDAGVGPAGPMDVHRLANDSADGLLQPALDGGQVRLPLPAVELRAIVSNQEAKISHGVGHTMRTYTGWESDGNVKAGDAWR